MTRFHARTTCRIIAAAALHLALAIRRHRVGRDDFLHRMLPF